MNPLSPLPAILLSALLCGQTSADELVFAGTLANSGGEGESRVTFSEEAAPGMGPVLDGEGMIWERAGSTQLNRYAQDGRLVAKFRIPENAGNDDMLTRAGNLLVMRIKNVIYTLPIDAEPGTEPTRLPGNVEVLSSGSFGGKVAVYEKKDGAISWLDPVTGERETITANPADAVQAIQVDGDGTVFAQIKGEMSAWKGGKAVDGFPKGIHGARPQKIGKHWFTHAGHGTINRMNEMFEPSPGVVLGGASGSFIGYLPQSVDLTTGSGMVRIDGDIYAVSGNAGVVQFLKWDQTGEKFNVVRRIGALPELGGVALDAAGNIWTGYGAWRWDDSPENPATLGDKKPDVAAQPVVLEGKTLCLVKKHYHYVQLAHGPIIDGNGWSHPETPGIDGFELPDSVTGAAAVPVKDRFDLVFVERGGKGYSVAVNAEGRRMTKVESCDLPGLKECTSLAWFDGKLIAADGGNLIAYERDGEKGWKEVDRIAGFGAEIHVGSDGSKLVVSDKEKGTLTVSDKWKNRYAKDIKLEAPTHVAISGSRLVVYESGKQRLVRFELKAGTADAPVLEIKAAPASTSAGKPAQHDVADFQDLGRPGGLPFSVAIADTGNKRLTVSVRTTAPELTLGIANGKEAFIFSEADGKATDGGWDFHLSAGDWAELRIAAALKAPGQQERFGFNDHKAIHAPFSKDPADWERFDLGEYAETITAQKQEIRVAFEVPADGKASVVIEDESGARVRNLVSGREFTAGAQSVVWDGLDESGKLVAPGKYDWRGVAHPGVDPVYKMHFANGGEESVAPWGPNHSTLQGATTNGEHMFFAAPVTEGGWALMALDADGNFVQGYEHQHGYGIQKDAIAADGKYLYCAQDGFTWGGTRNVDLDSDTWTAEWKLTVIRYDLATGKVVEFPGKKTAVEVDVMTVGPGSDHPDLDDFNLGGLAVLDGKLHVGSRNKDAVIVLDAGTGEPVESIPVKGVRHLTAHGGKVYAATDAGVVSLADRKMLTPAGGMDITGIALDAGGGIFVSDAAAHQVRKFTKDGKETGTIGKPGGPYKGAYDPARMVNPAGIAFDKTGKLWVTEDRWNPKRVLAWDLAKDEVVYEKFGMPHYGGDGSGFDPENPRRWIGLGCFWDVDIAAMTARPTHILSIEEGHFGKYHPQSYIFFREGGRTFVCARGKIGLISEVLEDGTLHDIVAVCGTHYFGYGCGWDPPQAYIDAFYAKWPEKRAQEKPGKKGEGKPWSQRGMGVLWVDRNGDGKTQQEEFDFCGDDIAFGPGAWGGLHTSLTLHVPSADDSGVRLVEIAPKSILPNGVPDYPKLDEAIAAGKPISLTPGYQRNDVATARDHKGRFIFNSDPEMNAYNADGSHAWSYPNQWSNVHGSHKAPLPEPGVMQGTLGILGVAKFDGTADVIFLNGNHGRCFMLTTDGIYIDEAFVDVRVSYLKNEYRLGGEIFGGSFGRAGDDGPFYVQIGHGPYRIYELEGLGEVKRISGSLDVTADQIKVAEQQNLRRAAEVKENRELELPGIAKWDQGGKFKAELDLKADATRLHLHYKVQDSSPWTNNGREWNKLFATGDTVDLQIGTDPAADPERRDPVPGDIRLMIAPFEGKPVAVLYEHRKPGGGNPVEFTSPWRGEKVDNVRLVGQAEIEVKTSGGGYEVIASVPLSELGLKLEPGKTYRADFGITFGDAGGSDTNLRSYWSNRNTHLVDDIPGEIMLTPNMWGELRIGEP